MKVIGITGEETNAPEIIQDCALHCNAICQTISASYDYHQFDGQELRKRHILKGLSLSRTIEAIKEQNCDFTIIKDIEYSEQIAEFKKAFGDKFISVYLSNPSRILLADEKGFDRIFDCSAYRRLTEFEDEVREWAQELMGY